MLSHEVMNNLKSHLSRVDIAAIPSISVIPAEHRSADWEKRILRKAAVVVPLCVIDNKPSLLFTVRSGQVSTHKSQVSFPGGHVELDETFEQAAQRELFEETKLKGNMIGRLRTMRAVTGTLVYPCVSVIESIDASIVEKGKSKIGKKNDLLDLLPYLDDIGKVSNEVDLVFGVSLDDLISPQYRSLQNLSVFFLFIYDLFCFDCMRVDLM